MKRRRLVAAAGAAVLILSIALPAAAAADTPATYTLDVWSCTVSDENGEGVDPQAIPAGSQIVFFEGWIANKRGQLQGFLNNASWVLIVDGTSVDVTPYLSGIINFGPVWGDLFATPPITIASGQTIETHYDNVLKSNNFDGVVHWSRGSLFGGGVDCSITAS